MANYNKTITLGTFTKDPELRNAGSTQVCDFTLAVNKKYKDKEEVCFIEFTAWGKQAEIICQYCGKGSQLFVEGELTQDTWTDKESGQKRSKLKITVREFQFIGGGKGGQQKSEGQQQKEPKYAYNATTGEADEMDSIPF